MATIVVDRPVYTDVVTGFTDETCCGVWSDTTQNLMVSRVTTWSNEMERRVKPRPLIYSPTSQAIQTTIKRKWGSPTYAHYRKYGCWCGPTYSTYWTYISKRSEPLDYWTAFPDPDWVVKARLAVKETKTNLGASLAEYRETTRMFLGFAKGLKKAYRIYRGKLPRSKRAGFSVRDMAEVNLINAWGVEPLVSDLVSSMEQLAVPNEALIRGFKVFVSDKFDETYGVEDPTSSVIFRKATLRTSKRAVFYVKYDSIPRNFTLGNPLEVAWEVLPFSWLVDWGIGVGDFLSSLDALKDVSFISGTLTTKKHALVSTTDKIYDADTRVYTACSPGTYEYSSHQRDVITSIPLPPLPTWKPSLSFRRVANGLSVLYLFRR